MDNLYVQGHMKNDYHFKKYLRKLYKSESNSNLNEVHQFFY